MTIRTVFNSARSAISTGLNPWGVPVWQPVKPFFYASLVVGYGVWSIQDTAMRSDGWKNDPRSAHLRSSQSIDH